MKPIWRDGNLTVELHKPDLVVLQKARDIGAGLVAMQQETGQPLFDAVDAILDPTAERPEQEEGDDGRTV